jgi:hypothetical protein
MLEMGLTVVAASGQARAAPVVTSSLTHSEEREQDEGGGNHVKRRATGTLQQWKSDERPEDRWPTGRHTTWLITYATLLTLTQQDAQKWLRRLHVLIPLVLNW